MDSIQEVINSLNAKQQKEFVFFIQRNKHRKGRKDLQLFQILKKGPQKTSKQIAALLNTPNPNAYHTIRKRLFAHLADFIVLQTTTRDASPTSHINALLSVVVYLFDKSLNKHAWKYLLVAEGIATKHEFSDLLNSIYLLQIEKCHLQENIKINQIIDQFNRNKITLIQREKIQIASILIQHKLLDYRKKGLLTDFNSLVNSSLKELSIDQSSALSPQASLEFIKIIRAGVLTTKSFCRFEHFLLECYHKSYENRKQYNPLVKSEFLYLIAHTYYRNRKFKLSASTLKELDLELDKCAKPEAETYEVKSKQLKAANFVFLNEIQDAIATLNALLCKKQSLSPVDRTHTITALAIFNFLNQDLNEAKKNGALLSKSDTWYQKNIGIEWLFKKKLMEIILYIDLCKKDPSYFDLVASKIKSFERSYKYLTHNPFYDRAFHYLTLVKKSMELGSKSLLKDQIQKTMQFLSFDQEDLQAISFYAWIKSKSTGEDFYDTLLELTNK